MNKKEGLANVGMTNEGKAIIVIHTYNEDYYIEGIVQVQI